MDCVSPVFVDVEFADCLVRESICFCIRSSFVIVTEAATVEEVDVCTPDCSNRWVWVVDWLCCDDCEFICSCMYRCPAVVGGPLSLGGFCAIDC